MADDHNLGLALDHWLSGALQAVLGTGVSEAMILTRPHRVADFAVTPTISGAQGSYGFAISIWL